MSSEPSDIPYVAPTLRAVFLDAVAPASFLEFLKLGTPGGLMMQLEGNSYDITNVLASLLGMHAPPCCITSSFFSSSWGEVLWTLLHYLSGHESPEGDSNKS